MKCSNAPGLLVLSRRLRLSPLSRWAHSGEEQRLNRRLGLSLLVVVPHLVRMGQVLILIKRNMLRLYVSVSVR